MPEHRNIFEDDKKLMQLCEDFLHHREELKQQARKDPEQTPTPSKLISILRYDNDPVPLTMEEYMELQDFVDNDFADWKLAIIQTSATEFLKEDGTLNNTAIDTSW
jgi:hypothetical protein